mmetsp:Transcript_71732/g.87955  ORF Transcript_71732/g.87955 Transcript_71732/m.87955 type:complete len:608 (+) Transcript_71732:55-1878(+)
MSLSDDVDIQVVEQKENLQCLVCYKKKDDHFRECIICGITVHEKCYGITKAREKDWKCGFCQRLQKEQYIKDPNGDVKIRIPNCVLCGSNEFGAFKLVGLSTYQNFETNDSKKIIINSNSNNDMDNALNKLNSQVSYAHLVCGLWLPYSYVRNWKKKSPIVNKYSELNVNYKNELKYRICAICGKNNAHIQCRLYKKCHKYYHPMCYIKLYPNNMIEEDIIISGKCTKIYYCYCPKHVKLHKSFDITKYQLKIKDKKAILKYEMLSSKDMYKQKKLKKKRKERHKCNDMMMNSNNNINNNHNNSNNNMGIPPQFPALPALSFPSNNNNGNVRLSLPDIFGNSNDKSNCNVSNKQMCMNNCDNNMLDMNLNHEIGIYNDRKRYNASESTFASTMDNNDFGGLNDNFDHLSSPNVNFGNTYDNNEMYMQNTINYYNTLQYSHNIRDDLMFDTQTQMFDTFPSTPIKSLPEYDLNYKSKSLIPSYTPTPGLTTYSQDYNISPNIMDDNSNIYIKDPTPLVMTCDNINIPIQTKPDNGINIDCSNEIKIDDTKMDVDIPLIHSFPISETINIDKCPVCETILPTNKDEMFEHFIDCRLKVIKKVKHSIKKL